ncbi:MAG: NADH-quinone oxidoreductase subunit F [Halanaeroarchaeum sp.]
MTTRPQFATDLNLLPGLVAAGLFAVMAAVFLGAGFPEQSGFPAGARITASIAYAMFDLGGTASTVASDGFLAAFEIIDLVLVAALVAAVMLARRDGESIRSRLGGER